MRTYNNRIRPHTGVTGLLFLARPGFARGSRGLRARGGEAEQRVGKLQRDDGGEGAEHGRDGVGDDGAEAHDVDGRQQRGEGVARRLTGGRLLDLHGQ